MLTLTLVRTRALRTPRLDHLSQILLPLFEPCLPLALPAGGGGARATTLAFCAHLCPDGDRPGPLHCLGSDLDPYPGLSADQAGMPEALPSCATKQQPDLLLRTFEGA